MSPEFDGKLSGLIGTAIGTSSSVNRKTAKETEIVVVCIKGDQMPLSPQPIWKGLGSQQRLSIGDRFNLDAN